MRNSSNNKHLKSMEIDQQSIDGCFIPKSQKKKFFKDLNKKANSTLKCYQKQEQIFLSKPKQIPILKQSFKNNQNTLNSLEWEVYQQIPQKKRRKSRIKTFQLDGYVELQYANGNLFKGTYQNGIRIQGIMIYKYAQCQYEGGFCGQSFAGYGRLTYKNGRTIQGQWQNKIFTGFATITYPNKDIYYGQVNQHLHKHGEGYLFMNNGSKYIGSFLNGSITGLGTYYKNNQVSIKGIWQKGKMIKEISSQQLGNYNQNFHIKQNQKLITNQFSYCFKEQILKDKLNEQQTQDLQNPFTK